MTRRASPPFATPLSLHFALVTSGEDVVDRLAAAADAAGIRRIHVLAWRDLDDPEAGGSELHAHEILSLWARAGLDINMRTSFSPGQRQVIWRNGYRVIRKAGRYMVFPRAAFTEWMGWHGGRDGLVGHTQPRRVAALSISRRIAEELNVNWGREVGSKVRFDDRTSPATVIKFLTDGMLLRAGPSPNRGRTRTSRDRSESTWRQTIGDC